MEITDFSEYYKTISNSELLAILDNPKGYQSLAIKAAKKEFSDRQLSTKEIQEARQPLIQTQLQKEKQKTQVKVIEEKVKATGYTLLETVNPIQFEIPTTEKTIRLVVLVFGAIFLYQAINQFNYIIAYIKDIERYPLLTAWILFPIILLPISIMNFLNRKSIGWILLTIYLTFSATDTLLSMMHSINRRTSSIANLNQLFPPLSLATYLFQILFFITTINILCKQNMRDTFRIKKETITKAVVMTSTLTFLLHFFI